MAVRNENPGRGHMVCTFSRVKLDYILRSKTKNPRPSKFASQVASFNAFSRMANGLLEYQVAHVVPKRVLEASQVAERYQCLLHGCELIRRFPTESPSSASPMWDFSNFVGAEPAFRRHSIAQEES